MHLYLGVAQGDPRILLCLWPWPHASAQVLLPHLCPPLEQRKVYLVEAVLTNFLLGITDAGTPTQAQSVVRQVLDLLWLFMEVRLPGSGPGPGGRAPLGAALGERQPWPRRCAARPLPQDYEVHDCLKQLMMSLLRLYRFSPIVPDLSLQVGARAAALHAGPTAHSEHPSPQVRYLQLTIAILKHERSRKFLLSNVLYPFPCRPVGRTGVLCGEQRPGAGEAVCLW